MNVEKLELLKSYIAANVAPLLVDFVVVDDIPNAVVLPANIKKEELNGHYENEKYFTPSWFNEITDTIEAKILVIDNIDSISKEEQLKFVELLKYRKISTFELPKDCIIIVTAKKIERNTINEEIYSLIVHIR